MKLVYSLIIAVALLFAACGGGSGENKQGKPKAIKEGPVYVGDENGNGVQYNYKDWKLVAEIPVKERNAHGTWTEYFDDGKIRLTIEYNMGMREGKSIEYYNTGEKYFESNYTNNKTDGTRYRYKKDGTIVFEIPYENGRPIPGIKEYDADGKLVEQPTIVFTRKGGNLEMKMSGRASSVEFYQWVKSEYFKTSGKNADGTVYQWVEGEYFKVPTENGVGKLILGSAKKGQITIRAIYKTNYGNMAAVDCKF